MPPKRKDGSRRTISAGRKLREVSDDHLGIDRDGRSLIIALKFTTRAVEVAQILGGESTLPLRSFKALSEPIDENSEARQRLITTLRFPTPDLAAQVVRILNSERKPSVATDEGYATGQDSTLQKRKLVVVLRFLTKAAEVASILRGIRSFPQVTASDFRFDKRKNPPRTRRSRRALKSKVQRGVSAAPAPQTVVLDLNAPMAPVEKVNVNDELKGVIHHLYELQLIANGYQPESNKRLETKVHELADALSDLSNLTLDASHPSSTTTASIQQTAIPGEILDYVDSGRNPDIYTRDFVEVVQKGNAILHGKQKAFGAFTRILGQEMKEQMPETGSEVDRMLESAGLDSPMEKVGGSGQGRNGG